MSLDAKQTQDFVQLLTSHQSALRVMILSMMPGQPGVSDVLQEINLVLWQKMKDFEPGSNFRAWAFSIARFKILEHLRKLKKDRHLVFDEELCNQLVEETDQDSKHTEAMQEALEACLSKVRPKDAQLLRHRYYQGGNLQEYAQAHNESAGALRVTLHRLRTSLRRCMVRKLKLDTL
ncbi:sigma-70 family RNA polymerase sigma factor [Verrucomicrobiaceae bacterium N1E253]|uniref:Sigma-70 family RNA polymerase sigma factor n=1 Tax=Oceaniferula marina TaxID=2748318 RepID=A0A851GK15_9BACT|nr:sigma-70 family RNA polymerase sigma factor [Oceaniferula marina]NWK55050.1 sigma-70 family RNA polymerase sigma factor [Oceaniferula marina]